MDKSILSLAGEFAVASELCRRGIYAQLTLGNRKRTDLLVETDTGMLRIQVKTKNVRNWPFCRGISGDDIMLVFVDYQNKQPDERPDFYILDPVDWEKMVNVTLKKDIEKGTVWLDDENCPIYPEHKKQARNPKIAIQL